MSGHKDAVSFIILTVMVMLIVNGDEEVLEEHWSLSFCNLLK